MFAHNMQTGQYGGAMATIWALARFFTILTNLAVAVTFGMAASRRGGFAASQHGNEAAPWIAALTLAMVLVGGTYHVLLAGITDFVGLGAWANHGLHSVVPVACLLWWLAYAPKRTLDYGDLPMFVLWPCLYVAYALARGAADGVYPYPFMDLPEKGAVEVAFNLAGLSIALLIGGVFFVMIGKFTDR